MVWKKKDWFFKMLPMNIDTAKYMAYMLSKGLLGSMHEMMVHTKKPYANNKPWAIYLSGVKFTSWSVGQKLILPGPPFPPLIKYLWGTGTIWIFAAAGNWIWVTCAVAMLMR